MSRDKVAIHIEPRVIAGVFREAMLTNREILLRNQYESTWTLVKDIVEVSQRDKAAKRKLRLNTSLLHSKVAEVLIPFGRHLFKGEISQVPESSSEYYFPDSLIQETQRRFERYKIPDPGAAGWSKVTLVQEDLTITGDFCAEEIGFNSTKGLLNIPAGLQLRHESLLIGTVQTKSGSIKINGRILRAVEVAAGEEEVYRVVVRNALSEPSNPTKEVPTKERRSEKRYPATISIKLVSPIHQRTFTIQVSEVTSTTFRGTIHDIQQLSHLAFGIDYQVENREMFFHLVASRREEYVFEVVSSDERSLKWWFEQYSGAVHPTLYYETASASEVLRLFCEAGAFSPNYIKGNRLNVRSIEDGFNSAHESNWIHRWIEIKDGVYSGYISAIHLMRGLWIIGDLVGGQSEENKISSHFISSFFYAFTRFIRAFKPDHHILLTWLRNHPVWTNLQNHIEDRQEYVASKLSCNYTRISGETWASKTKMDSELEVTNLNLNSDFLKKEPFSKDERSLIERFIAASKLGSKRSIDFESGGITTGFSISAEGKKLYCFFVQFPEGASINRLPQSVFVFDPSRICTEQNWFSIRSTLVSYCGRNSLFPSSIRRMTAYEDDSCFSSEMANMRLYLVNPGVFDDYG